MRSVNFSRDNLSVQWRYVNSNFKQMGLWELVSKRVKKTVKGTTVFDTSIDVEATQEFNIQDLIEKTKSHIKADDKSKADDDSLITGDDVMDQMDSLFGFED